MLKYKMLRNECDSVVSGTAAVVLLTTDFSTTEVSCNLLLLITTGEIPA